MLKKLLVLEGNKIPHNKVNVDLFDRIILTSGLDEKMSTKLIDKVKTISQYENELKFSQTGF